MKREPQNGASLHEPPKYDIYIIKFTTIACIIRFTLLHLVR